jgi:hypothetical protein
MNLRPAGASGGRNFGALTSTHRIESASSADRSRYPKPKFLAELNSSVHLAIFDILSARRAAISWETLRTQRSQWWRWHSVEPRCTPIPDESLDFAMTIELERYRGRLIEDLGAIQTPGDVESHRAQTICFRTVSVLSVSSYIRKSAWSMESVPRR